MRRILYSGLVLFIFLSNAFAATITVTLDELVHKVKTANYTVAAEAYRVYQAKRAIDAARGSLIPSVKIATIVKIIIDPISIIDAIEDLVPFLIPNNWFRFKETEYLYAAKLEAYRALWANEIHTAKALYYRILLDCITIEQFQKQKAELEKLLLLVQSRQKFGGLPLKITSDLKLNILKLENIIQDFGFLLREEKRQLSYMMGLTADFEIILKPVSIPDPSSFKELDASFFEFRAVDSSPEMHEYDKLIEVADYISDEIIFSIFGTSSQSRGVNGGIFDHIPIGSGLGFGSPPAVAIAGAQKGIFYEMKKGAEEVVKRQLKSTVDRYNLELQKFKIAQMQWLEAKKTLDRLYDRIKLGAHVDIQDMVESIERYIHADTESKAVPYRFLIADDRLSRILFEGDYTSGKVR